MEHGYPFDVAFAVDDNMRAALCLIVSEHNGRTFDWDLMKFKDER